MTVREFQQRQMKWALFHSWEENEMGKYPNSNPMQSVGGLFELYIASGVCNQDWDRSFVEGIRNLRRKLALI